MNPSMRGRDSYFKIVVDRFRKLWPSNLENTHAIFIEQKCVLYFFLQIKIPYLLVAFST